MTRHLWKPITLLLATVPLLVGAATAKPAAEPFDAATMIVEVNATDGDAGLQVFLDHGPWSAVRIFKPDGTKMLDIKTKGDLKDYGLTELFSESSEPPFTEFPLAKFKKLWPEGEYRFEGTTIEGDELASTATLSHDIPKGPTIIRPQEDSKVSGKVKVRWEPVSEPPGIEIVSYQVIVEREDPLRVFRVDLPPDATAVKVPAAFIETGVEYKAEVVAIEAGGNQTLSEVAFETE
ncbi:MAG: hypothetical protein ACRDKF_11470 [Actinomycetota bacterium]